MRVVIKGDGSGIVLINYADKNYEKARSLQTKSPLKVGFNKIIEYGPGDVEPDFLQAHIDIFQVKRGNGLWLWKPYLIKKTLEDLNDGSILFYCDSGACFFRNIKPILNVLNRQDVWLSTLPLKEKYFTKKRAFQIMDCSGEQYTETAQISGSYIAIRKSEFSLRFVEEWLNYCCMIEAIAPVEDVKQEVVNFYAHREDQSILSLLAKKHKVRAYSDPSQYGRLPEKYIRPGCEMIYYGGLAGTEDYKPCILHHRSKDVNKKIIINQWLCAVLPRRVGLMLIDRH